MNRRIPKRAVDLAAALRGSLHAVPELSGQEARTRARLMAFLAAYTSLECFPLAGGLAAAHREAADAPAIAVRADMDAIPGTDGPFHGCGHDGHSAILALLALLLEGQTLGRNVLLLFQDAEETGAGAAPLCEALLRRERVDRILGFHNLPGNPLGTALLRPGVFACASEGLTLRLAGVQAHAAYPGQGKNPLPPLCETVAALPALTVRVRAAAGAGADELLLATPVGLSGGGARFGVAAGDGALHLTLRSTRLTLLQALEAEITAFVQARADGMALTLSRQDVFPDTANDPALAARAEQLLLSQGLPCRRLEAPMRWSEDFGHFAGRIPALYLGIGAGVDCAPLHTPGYAFPDALLEPAAAILLALVESL